ncbi:hypothetical protein FHG87_021573 [Trinorchestia longiramus]|nr:hypothetical protein FHG87_021573 [Trinorchestia longiramus]
MRSSSLSYVNPWFESPSSTLFFPGSGTRDQTDYFLIVKHISRPYESLPLHTLSTEGQEQSLRAASLVLRCETLLVLGAVEAALLTVVVVAVEVVEVLAAEALVEVLELVTVVLAVTLVDVAILAVEFILETDVVDVELARGVEGVEEVRGSPAEDVVVVVVDEDPWTLEVDVVRTLASTTPSRVFLQSHRKKHTTRSRITTHHYQSKRQAVKPHFQPPSFYLASNIGPSCDDLLQNSSIVRLQAGISSNLGDRIAYSGMRDAILLTLVAVPTSII